AEAVIEASRCLFCHDAPCIQACPTSIDIPMFIRQIMSKNTGGAGKTILSQNILGKSCGQVCPTEVLCEGACVYNDLNIKPIEIGRLQAYATQHVIDNNIRFFQAGNFTGKKVAVIGGGPAGLSCAHELTKLGHQVTVFESNPKLGGLNAYGVAPYKLSNEAAQQEVDYITQIGFDVQTQVRVTTHQQEMNGSGKKQILLSDLEKDYDAIYLAMGLGHSVLPQIPGIQLEGVQGAAEYIHRLRSNPLQMDVGKRVIVVGAGNTAIDAAVESRKLGAEVTLIYRRTEQDQNAYYFEVELAKTQGVQFRYLLSPVAVMGQNSKVEGLQVIHNQLCKSTSGNAKPDIQPISGTEEILSCDMVIFATGQAKQVSFFEAISGIQLNNGKISVSETFQTHNPKYFAGGDCVNGGKEVVNAVAHGRDGARGIHQYLMQSS
ncbi:MAG: NAD(P)-dependent oxidoreductase, partial [Cyanobacteria bacterium]|nr:NAD(P)-dependent oxidoreductase [Cyanobacteriota bacterium]